MNKRHYEHTLPNIRGSLSNTYNIPTCLYIFFDAFSAYLKNNFKPEPGNRAESLYTREN